MKTYTWTCPTSRMIPVALGIKGHGYNVKKLVFFHDIAYNSITLFDDL